MSQRFCPSVIPVERWGMPTISTNSREDYIEATFPQILVVGGAATGREVLGDEDWLEFFRCNLHELLEEASLDFGMRKTSLVGIKGCEGFIVTLSDGMQMPMASFEYGYGGHRTGTLELPEQRTTAGLSALVRSQVARFVTEIGPRLRERLSQFGNDWPDREPVSASTKSAVKDLVAWLCSQSETVSATVSSDGILSIATVFPNDVRLYVEVERDGSIGAAVTRKRRYARDISGNTVADLTPEVILAAVGSI